MTTSTDSFIDIDITNVPNCKVTAVRVFFYITATNLATATAGGFGTIKLHSANSIDYALIRQTGAPLTGTSIGSSCGSLVFQAGGADFATATPPYNGTFRPAGESGGGPIDSTFDVFKGQLANGNWHLHPFLSGPVDIQCFRLELTVS